MEERKQILISHEEYLDSLPPGYHFSPSHEELINSYLKRKIAGDPLPPNKMKVVQLYDFHPHQLFEMYNQPRDKDLYVFTKPVKKHANGHRKNRVNADDSGFWRARQVMDVRDGDGNVIWEKTSLVFQEGKSKQSVKTNWLMQEYELGQSQHQANEWVLCKIYQHKNKNERGGERFNDVNMPNASSSSGASLVPAAATPDSHQVVANYITDHASSKLPAASTTTDHHQNYFDGLNSTFNHGGTMAVQPQPINMIYYPTEEAAEVGSNIHYCNQQYYGWWPKQDR